jgi:hypothetical protein
MNISCIFCNSLYKNGTTEGSLTETNPLTFECGTYLDFELVSKQTEECKKKTEERFEIKTKVNPCDYIMGMKSLDDMDFSIGIKAPDLSAERFNAYQKNVNSLIDKLGK